MSELWIVDTNVWNLWNPETNVCTLWIADTKSGLCGLQTKISGLCGLQTQSLDSVVNRHKCQNSWIAHTNVSTAFSHFMKKKICNFMKNTVNIYVSFLYLNSVTLLHGINIKDMYIWLATSYFPYVYMAGHAILPLQSYVKQFS